ncbi:methyltransferase domain-containing protein [Streptomyces verrucosisporus]|uniref:methyltransferase domain-containing protein n=1 Tax=Streptomyces verrucosisporus TaxID=1695161 RepID=UPI0019D052DF|nr:methyltransferase domain-containing protein [Streptomyces verrucosisporus]MBN3931171.1 methyltransferase domain-containing protein [Streptomyces verrucosisporus]
MTTPTTTDPARDLRTALAHQVAAPDDPWRAAFETVPRHVFVPSFHEQAEDGRWTTVTPDQPRYWEAVYSDRALTTQLTDGTPTSSSSQPSLMLEMLHALDVADGHRVLEVGTGTGYNAALLSHRLGGSRVTTMDVDPGLTGAAAQRLGEAGHHPAVRTGDGAHGVPDRAPYDQIIATCGLPSVPWPWVEQAADGAVIVVPIGWGVARLAVHGDVAEGGFLPGGAYFMARRVGVPVPDFASLERAGHRSSGTGTPIEAFHRLEFLVSVTMPGYQWCVWNSGDDGTGESLGLWTPDGSIARVHADGTVRQAGPRRLWETVEELHRQFPDTAPARDAFGITATPHRQWVWLGDPQGPSWDLPSVGGLS